MWSLDREQLAEKNTPVSTGDSIAATGREWIMARRIDLRAWSGAILLGAFGLSAAPAATQTLWKAQQVTFTVPPEPYRATVGTPALSADGSALAFLSIGDLGGTNPLASPELFAYLRDSDSFEKLTDYDIPGGFMPNNTMRQLSRDGGMALYTEDDGLGGMHWVLQESLTGVRQKEGPDYAVFLNPSATFVLFFSNDDLAGENADGSWELYLYDIGHDSFAQLTHDVIVFGMEAVANDNGTRIVIMSPNDLVPGSNPDGSVELFSLNPATGVWTQLTSTPQGSTFWDLTMDTAGSRVAFISSFDFTGENPNGGWEVFLLRVATGSIFQLTHNAIPLDIKATISGNGDAVAIATSRDLTGDNPNHNGALFVFDVRSGTLQQVTDASLGSVVTAPPAVDGSGTTVAVAAGGDFAGTNPDGNAEIFLFSRPGARPGIPAGGPLARLLLVLLIGMSGASLLIRRTMET